MSERILRCGVGGTGLSATAGIRREDGPRSEREIRKPQAETQGSTIVTRYGMRLLPELFEQLNPMTFDEAVATEVELANGLHGRGYTVFGGG